MFKNADAFSGFSVNDLAAAKEFYGQTLGLKISDEGVNMRIHTTGPQGVFVYQKDDHVPATYTMLNFEVDDIDVAVKALQDEGVTIEHYNDLTDEHVILRGLANNDGPDIAWFKDPAGNILSVLNEG